MSSGSPSEVLRAHFDTFARGGLDEAAKLWDRDIEWHAVAGALDDVGLIRGHAAMRRTTPMSGRYDVIALIRSSRTANSAMATSTAPARMPEPTVRR